MEEETGSLLLHHGLEMHDGSFKSCRMLFFVIELSTIVEGGVGGYGEWGVGDQEILCRQFYLISVNTLNATAPTIGLRVYLDR